MNKIFRRNELLLIRLTELLATDLLYRMMNEHTNPINRYGSKCFSQNDEDGITLEILRRIGLLENGSFAEFGVDDGTENNTLVLKSLNWIGFWVGGEKLSHLPTSASGFTYIQDWITSENIIQLTKRGAESLGIQELDLISLDLDGNDYYFVERLLAGGFLPKVFIVEYNAKFPPPIQWKISYDASHTWNRDEYFGASLSSFDGLFKKFGYQLVCCNVTGANAFFVKNEFMDLFEDIPRDIRDIYAPPKYGLQYPFHYKPSPDTLRQFF